MSKKVTNPFLGKWRIIEMEQWGQNYVDLVVPGYINFDDGGGKFQFGTVTGFIDYRVEAYGNGTRLEFSWDGKSDSDDACGRGWVISSGDAITGHIFIHQSDDSWFRAKLTK